MDGKIHVKSGELKYVQIHDLDDSYNNGRVHCSYDLRLQIKQREVLLVGLNKMRCNRPSLINLAM